MTDDFFLDQAAEPGLDPHWVQVDGITESAELRFETAADSTYPLGD
ncbi:hypothetical protein [Pilimelia columellifera]